ncbi:MAG TPA: GNAT family N-acetyltransferase [Candidatus Limnocylindrales bacterium]|nr:GNAT family N-acetyltransferase [Candidatus Limnocylindrales bacterium]
MGEGVIEIVPATGDRWDDVARVLGPNGDRGCWCQAPRGFASGYGRDERGRRRELLRAQLDEDPPAGMLAYLDGEVAGWCGFGVRTRLPRLERSRTIPKVDDRPVWSILCFNVRTGFRRKGVAAALLAGVVDYARRAGAPGVEAYPIDAEGGRVNSSFGYVGVTPMFEKAGFERILETGARSDSRPRILMRLMF